MIAALLEIAVAAVVLGVGASHDRKGEVSPAEVPLSR
jgi:hypothetical protein